MAFIFVFPSNSMAIGNSVVSATAGSVLYADGSSNLGQDNANLYYDATNHILKFVKWAPKADSTTALQFFKADGSTLLLTMDTTNNRITLGNAANSQGFGFEVHTPNSNGVAFISEVSAFPLFYFYDNASHPVATMGGVSSASAFQICVGSGGQIGFSTTNTNATTIDTGFNRNAAGVIEINNGTAGTYRDLILRNLNVASGGSTSIGAGVGSVKMTSGNAATNTAWIPIQYAGSQYYIPAWTTNNP